MTKQFSNLNVYEIDVGDKLETFVMDFKNNYGGKPNVPTVFLK